MKTNGSKNNINPNSPKYNEKIRNKAIEKTPTGENEPSLNTTYK